MKKNVNCCQVVMHLISILEVSSSNLMSVKIDLAVIILYHTRFVLLVIVFQRVSEHSKVVFQRTQLCVCMQQKRIQKEHLNFINDLNLIIIVAHLMNNTSSAVIIRSTITYPSLLTVIFVLRDRVTLSKQNRNNYSRVA